MRSHRHAGCAGRLGLVLVALSVCPAAGAGDLARVMPAETALYIGWSPWCTPNSPELRAAEKTWRAMAGFAAEAAATDPGFTTVQRVLDALPLLASRSGAIGLFDVTFAEGQPDFQAALVLESPNDGPRLAEAVHNIVAAAGAAEQIGRHTVKDVPLECVPLGNTAMNLVWGVHEHHFLLALGDVAAGKVIDSIHGQGPTLADAPELVFDRQKAQCRTDGGHVCAYVDVQRVITRAKEVATQAGMELPPIVDAALRELGLTAIRSKYVHWQQRDGESRFTAFAHLEGPPHGVLKLWDQKALTDDDLKILPKNTYWAAIGNLDLYGLWEETLRILEELAPDQVPVVEGALTMSKTIIGFSLTDDLLRSLGDTWAVFDAPDHGGLLLSGTVLAVEVVNQEELQRILERGVQFVTALAASKNLKVLTKETRHGEHEIHYLLLGGTPVPIAPAWGFVNGRWVFGLCPQTVAAAMRQVDPKTRGETLLDHPDVKAARAKLPAPAQGLYYCDARYFARMWYPLATAAQTLGASILANHGAEVDLAVLPPLPDAVADVHNFVATSSRDQDGITYASIGSGSPAIAAAVPTALVASVLMPSLARAREIAKRAVSESNLRDIGRACERYAVDRTDEYPATLGDLRGAGLVTAGQLRSPRDPTADTISYAYVAGQTRASDSRNVLAYEQPYDREGTNVLFVDGRAEWLDLEELKLLLRATYERLDRRDEMPERFPLPSPDE